MTDRKTRIKDIAKLAGVSIGTVDRVIHNRGEVAEKTRLRVQKILQETSYSPNIMAQALKTKKQFHLVSLLPAPGEDNAYWKRHPAGMLKALSELEPFEVVMTRLTFDMQSEEDFQTKAASVFDIMPDGVLLAPIFKSESISFCKMLSELNIPFVFVDGLIENTDFLAYVGEDIFQSGRVAGQLTDIITPADSDILVVTIARNITNVHHLKERADGFLRYFKDSGKNMGKKISLNIDSPTFDQVNTALEKALAENPAIGSIFFTGSRSYMAASFLEDNKRKNINLIGYDLLDSNVSFLKSGITKFLIGQRPEEQTYKGIKKLFEYLSLHKVPEKIEYLPVDIVTSENVDFFMK